MILNRASKNNTKIMRRFTVELALVGLCVMTCFTAAEDGYYNDEEEIDLAELRRRRKEKLFSYWALRNFQVGGMEIPLSPVTLFTLSLVLFHVYMNWGTYAWCEASHILIKGHDQETVNKLKKMKKEIGSDAKKFAELAKEHSECPSCKLCL